MRILPNKKLVLLCTLLSVQFTLLQAQTSNEAQYLPGQFYFKIIDDYQTFFNRQSPEVNIAEQLPFFVPLAEEFGARVQSTFYFSRSETLYRTFRVTIKEPRRSQEFLEKMRQQGEVEYTEPVPLFTTNHTPSDLGADDLMEQWYLHRIMAEGAWDLSQGSDVVVAVIDNGFSGKHEDLYDKWTSGFDVADYDYDPFIERGSFWHGTHVAGLVGAKTDNRLGLASIGHKAIIMPVKATSDSSGDPTIIDNGLEGITWASEHGAKIINISWGWQSSYLDAETIYTIQNTINLAHALGTVIVAAAGNFNETALFYPAACEHVISVASTNENDKKSPTSNFGEWIDIAAPGHHILSTYPSGGYDWESGTSMAAPLVSGTLALMFALRPDMTPEEAENCLKAGVDPVNDYVGLIGVGRLNALQALKCVAEQVQQDNDENEVANYVFNRFSAAPNPMNEYALIEYQLKVASKVHLKVYNRFGVAITLLESVYQQPGYYQAKFKRGNLPAGIYYYQLQVRDFVETKKLVISE